MVKSLEIKSLTSLKWLEKYKNLNKNIVVKIFLKIGAICALIYLIIYVFYKLISFPLGMIDNEERVELINDLYLEKVDGYPDISQRVNSGVYFVIYNEQIDSIAITKNYIIVRNVNMYYFISVDKAKITHIINKDSLYSLIGEKHKPILFNSPREIFDKYSSK